jgi:DNA-binding transcriptional LysR family regulator
MHLEGLKVFCDVVRYRSFSRAASEHHVSQSAASQAVLQIEKRLGCDLIDRSKRPWNLTPVGKHFFEGCQEIVNRYVELEEAVRRQATSGYKVRVAAIYSVGLQDMSHLVERFRAEVPGADADLDYMHPARVYKAVQNDEADLGLISFAHGGQDLVTTAWREEPMVFTCLRGHRMARQKAVRPSELNRERFVAFEKGLAIRREVDRYLRRHGVEVEVVAEFDNIATIKQAVEDGAGVAILPEPTLRREVERRALAAVPFSGARFVRPLSIIHRKKRKLNNAVRGFMSLLCQAKVWPQGVPPGAGAPAAEAMPPGGRGKSSRRGDSAGRNGTNGARRRSASRRVQG